MNKLKQLKKEYLGPDYDYAKQVPSPNDLGVSGGGNFSVLMTDIEALMKYITILTFGDPPLGYNFFIRSGKCNNDKNGKACNLLKGNCVNRYIYVKNIPSGNIPGLAQLGLTNTPFKGMVPALAEDAGQLATVPKKLWDDLSGKGSKVPNKCKLVTRSVGPSTGTHNETRWVPIIEPFKNDNLYLLFGICCLFFVILYFQKRK